MNGRAFTEFGGFTSGVAIHYDSSAIVDASYQHLAPHLVVGERVLPQVFIRAADALPVEIHDLLPADARFKVLVFAGDLAVEEDSSELHKLAEELDKPENFVCRFGRGETGRREVFDVLCFSSAKQDKVDYLRTSRSHCYISRRLLTFRLSLQNSRRSSVPITRSTYRLCCDLTECLVC